MRVFSFFVAVICLSNCGQAYAEKWADLTVTFVYDGTPVAPKAIGNLPQGCNQFSLYTESLLVDPTTKGIANIVFMVDGKKSNVETASIHPDLQKVPTDKPVLDNVKCQFVPHVLQLRAGQTIEVKNSDETGHNAKFSFFNNPEANPMIPAGASKQIEIKKEESAPIPVECNIHPFMKAYTIIADHPYVGISNEKGQIKIEKLPAGKELTFKLWHESQNKFDEVTVNGKKESWKKGITKLTLKEGSNDLGTVVIDASKFK